MEFREFKQAVIDAIKFSNIERLNHLFNVEPRWYEDVIEEVESHAGCRGGYTVGLSYAERAIKKGGK